MAVVGYGGGLKTELQGLKPDESKHSTSELKLRPPKEKTSCYRGNVMLRGGGPKCGLLRAFLDAWCDLRRVASWSRRIRASSLPRASPDGVRGFLGTPETGRLFRIRREFRPAHWRAGPTKGPRPGGAALRLRRASARHADNSFYRRIVSARGLQLR